MVDELIEKVIRKEMVVATKAMKLRTAAELSEVCAEMISASGEVGISVVMKRL